MKNYNKTYGYVVASYGNRDSITEQMCMLEKFAPDSILSDREYKSKTDRMSLNHIIEMLRPKDLLVTTKLSNLGRSYTEVLENYKRIIDRSAFMVTLENPVVDTRPGKQGTEETAAEFLILLTEMERKRSAGVSKGLEEAKLRGVHVGARKKEPPEQFLQYKEYWENKEISANEAGKRLGISRNTFMRWVRES